MEQDTKTVTMPLSEFEQMRSELAMYKSKREEIQKSEETIIKECENRLGKLLGCSIDEVLHYRINNRGRCSFLTHINLLNKEIESLREEDRNKNNRIIILENEISNLKHRKWYQFWKR